MYRLTITLLDVQPPVWRLIDVPENYTFWDLHVAIQDAMGWLDCHLHAFEPAVEGSATPIGRLFSKLVNWQVDKPLKRLMSH